MHTLYTIGYSGHTIDSMMATLKESGSPVLVDVRYSAFSRKPGFSSKKLPELAEANGIRYVYMRSLGNVNYKGLAPLKLHDEEAGLADLTSLLEESDAVVMCVCPELSECHRRYIVEAMSSRHPSLPVVHL